MRSWSTTIAVVRPSSRSTSGRLRLGMKPWTKALYVSLISRCDSAAMVAKTRELLPEPETPVKTVSRRLGTSRLTFFRLFSRAPCTRMRSCESAACTGPSYLETNLARPDTALIVVSRRRGGFFKTARSHRWRCGRKGLGGGSHLERTQLVRDAPNTEACHAARASRHTDPSSQLAVLQRPPAARTVVGNDLPDHGSECG